MGIRCENVKWIEVALGKLQYPASVIQWFHINGESCALGVCIVRKLPHFCY